MRKITFDKPTKFLGRNGYFKCTGLFVTENPNGEVWIEPITGKDEVGRCRIEIPVEALTEVIASLNGIDVASILGLTK